MRHLGNIFEFADAAIFLIHKMAFGNWFACINISVTYWAYVKISL